MAKRAMSSEKASFVKRKGHERERIFVKLIGVNSEYKNNRQAKKDVVDDNGDAHSLKGGQYWQIFLYRYNRINNDPGFKVMNGIGQLIIKCMECFPDNFEEYQKDKAKSKNKLKEPMEEIKNKLLHKDKLEAFLSKSLFNSGEVQYLTIFDEEENIHIFYNLDVVRILKEKLDVVNSKARNVNQFDNQKVVFYVNKICVGEIEMRNDSKQHYREIKFRLHGYKILNYLKEYINDVQKPTTINGIANEKITLYGQAIKKFKR